MTATSTALVYADTGDLISARAPVTVAGRMAGSQGTGSLNITEELSLTEI